MEQYSSEEVIAMIIHTRKLVKRQLENDGVVNLSAERSLAKLEEEIGERILFSDDISEELLTLLEESE